MFGIAGAVAFFQITDCQSSQMLAESVTHQSGAVPLGATGSLIGCPQELLVQHDLHGFHMWSLLHSAVHKQEGCSLLLVLFHVRPTGLLGSRPGASLCSFMPLKLLILEVERRE